MLRIHLACHWCYRGSLNSSGSSFAPFFMHMQVQYPFTNESFVDRLLAVRMILKGLARKPSATVSQLRGPSHLCQD